VRRKPGLIEQLAKAEKAEKENTAKMREHLALVVAGIEPAQRAALCQAVIDLVVDHYNKVEMGEGDAIGAVLPVALFERLLDWYFDPDQPNEQPDFGLMPAENKEVI